MPRKIHPLIVISSVACTLALQATDAPAQSVFDFFFGAPQYARPQPVQPWYPTRPLAPGRRFESADPGLRTFRPRAHRERAGEDPQPMARSGSGYRTLCVRSCDGFFWPISHSTSSGQFKQDEKMCKASCPNQKVALYIHRTSGQWSEDAVSLADEPLSKMKNAFLFRTEYKPDCKCQAPHTLIAARRDATKQAGVTPLPASIRTDGKKALIRTAAATGSDADAEITGSTGRPNGSKPSGNQDEPAKHGAPSEPTRKPDPSRPVRVVGPAFFPDQ